MTVKELVHRLEEISAFYSDDIQVMDSHCEPLGITVRPHPTSAVPTIIIF